MASSMRRMSANGMNTSSRALGARDADKKMTSHTLGQVLHELGVDEIEDELSDSDSDDDKRPGRTGSEFHQSQFLQQKQLQQQKQQADAPQTQTKQLTSTASFKGFDENAPIIRIQSQHTLRPPSMQNLHQHQQYQQQPPPQPQPQYVDIRQPSPTVKVILPRRLSLQEMRDDPFAANNSNQHHAPPQQQIQQNYHQHQNQQPYQQQYVDDAPSIAPDQYQRYDQQYGYQPRSSQQPHIQQPAPPLAQVRYSSPAVQQQHYQQEVYYDQQGRPYYVHADGSSRYFDDDYDNNGQQQNYNNNYSNHNPVYQQQQSQPVFVEQQQKQQQYYPQEEYVDPHQPHYNHNNEQHKPHHPHHNHGHHQNHHPHPQHNQQYEEPYQSNDYQGNYQETAPQSYHQTQHAQQSPQHQPQSHHQRRPSDQSSLAGHVDIAASTATNNPAPATTPGKPKNVPFEDNPMRLTKKPSMSTMVASSAPAAAAAENHNSSGASITSNFAVSPRKAFIDPAQVVAEVAKDASTTVLKSFDPTKLSEDEQVKLSLRLSKQESRYGKNMFEDIRDADRSEIETLESFGFAFKDAVERIFTERNDVVVTEVIKDTATEDAELELVSEPALVQVEDQKQKQHVRRKSVSASVSMIDNPLRRKPSGIPPIEAILGTDNSNHSNNNSNSNTPRGTAGSNSSLSPSVDSFQRTNSPPPASLSHISSNNNMMRKLSPATGISFADEAMMPDDGTTFTMNSGTTTNAERITSSSASFSSSASYSSPPQSMNPSLQPIQHQQYQNQQQHPQLSVHIPNSNQQPYQNNSNNYNQKSLSRTSSFQSNQSVPEHSYYQPSTGDNLSPRSMGDYHQYNNQQPQYNNNNYNNNNQQQQQYPNQNYNTNNGNYPVDSYDPYNQQQSQQYYVQSDSPNSRGLPGNGQMSFGSPDRPPTSRQNSATNNNNQQLQPGQQGLPPMSSGHHRRTSSGVSVTSIPPLPPRSNSGNNNYYNNNTNDYYNNSNYINDNNNGYGNSHSPSPQRQASPSPTSFAPPPAVRRGSVLPMSMIQKMRMDALARLPESEQLRITMLLSKQDEVHGTNMFDSLTPDDQSAVDYWLSLGYKFEKIALFIFQGKKGAPMGETPQGA